MDARLIETAFRGKDFETGRTVNFWKASHID
jgi:hypothetical protein